MDRTRKYLLSERPNDPEVQAEPETVGAAAPTEPVPRVADHLGELLAAAVSLHADLSRRLESALRENKAFIFDIDVNGEVRDLKEANAVIRRVMAVLEALKKANNARLDDLKWVKRLQAPAARGVDEP